MILAHDLNGTPIDFRRSAVRGPEHAHHPPNLGSGRHAAGAVGFLTLGKAADEDSDLQLRLLCRARSKSEGERD